jgi:hypothetical protein
MNFNDNKLTTASQVVKAASGRAFESQSAMTCKSTMVVVTASRLDSDCNACK